MKHILTFAGTGAQQVPHIFSAIDERLVVRFVDTVQDARARRADGVLLLGGVDVNPSYYGEWPIYSQPGNRERDAVEWALARRAFNEELPIMGICRGHQMLAVAAGGSLYQDINRQGITRHDHTYNRHPLVRVRPKLAGHLASEVVNSYHHQAVCRVPDGYKVLAESEDGIVEAIWRPGALGVQWHPEMMVQTNSRWLGLFRWFVSGLT